MEISIHALREEGDLLKRKIIKKLLIFLSTPSARRATEIPYSQYTVKEFLSTPSARRATSRQMVQSLTTLISIHALREEGDLCKPQQLVATLISIHALREEGDATRPSPSTG